MGLGFVARAIGPSLGGGRRDRDVLNVDYHSY